MLCVLRGDVSYGSIVCRSLGCPTGCASLKCGIAVAGLVGAAAPDRVSSAGHVTAGQRARMSLRETAQVIGPSVAACTLAPARESAAAAC